MGSDADSKLGRVPSNFTPSSMLRLSVERMMEAASAHAIFCCGDCDGVSGYIQERRASTVKVEKSPT